MSTGMFKGLSDHPLKLQNVDLKICPINGRSLDVLGMVNLDLTIGPLHVQHDIIVADIQMDMILGMDFLSKHGCKVDINNHTEHCGVSVEGGCNTTKLFCESTEDLHSREISDDSDG